MQEQTGRNLFTWLRMGCRNESHSIGHYGDQGICIEDKLGSIEEGKLADIIAVKGNPLDDISILENIEVIIKDGVVY